MASEKKSFWDRLKAIHAVVAAWCFKYIGGLFMEEKDGKMVVSLGRVLLLIVFMIMVWFWVFKKVQANSDLEMPDMLYETFVALCTYVFGSKIASGLKLRWGNGYGKPGAAHGLAPIAVSPSGAAGDQPAPEGP